MCLFQYVIVFTATPNSWGCVEDAPRDERQIIKGFKEQVTFR